MTTFTYEEITAHTESNVRHYMEKADADRALGDKSSARQRRAWAFGAWNAWWSLTAECQADGDSDRIYNLIERKTE